MESAVRNLQITLILAIVGITLNAQPVQVTEIPETSTNFTNIGNLVYFTVGNALWRTDGTAQGTIQLKTGFTGFSEFTEFNGRLFFRSGKTPQTGQVAWSELWASNGTPSGTVLLKRSSSYDVSIAGTTNTYLFFAASDLATGWELYRSNGTVAGTALVRDLFPGTGNGFRGSSAGVGNLLFFAGNNGTSGTELWKSNGTSSGTVMVENINPGSANGMSGDVISYNNLFYFRGNNGVNGPEPWVSDGSAAGTFMLKDIFPGSSGTGPLEYGIGNNGSVYFLVWLANPDGNVSEPDLWRSSGTAASTVKVRTVGYPENSDEYYGFLTYQSNVYFIQRVANFSDTFWKSDGTPQGTNTFYSLDDTWNDGITFFDVVKDHLLFTGISQGYAFPLLRHDGTRTEAAYHFKSSGFTGGGRHITAPHVEKSGNFAFFADHEGPIDDGGTPSSEGDYFHLFQTDGVTTQSMRTLHGVNITGVEDISDFNGKVIFTTHDDYFAPTEDFKRLWIYDPSAPATGAGKLSVESWNGISGTQVSSIPVNSPPSSTSEITIFETPNNIGDNYGSRVRGYVIPPATGNYTFWISSDDRSELWLSTDESPANKVRIAYVNGWTTPRQWGKYTTQRSALISLVAGRRYYVEALLKEGTGGDHLAVGWQLPGGALERPIPGNRLIAFETSSLTGTIDIETWTGISGTHVSSIPVDSPPDFESELTIFETPRNVGDNYGSRVRGYVHAPTTGNYTFWIASDDRSELWLSTDEDPANKVRIAHVSGWTTSRQWDKYTSQRSAPVSLVAGRKYYIEALLKEGTGGDHLAVGWQLPGGALERPIPGSRLSEFETSSSTMARRTETTQDETLFSHINIYPNPAASKDVELRLGGYENITETIETQVEIINMTGEVIYSENVRCGGDCGSYLMKINKQLVPGVYLVNLKTNGTRFSKRLLVR